MGAKKQVKYSQSIVYCSTRNTSLCDFYNIMTLLDLLLRLRSKIRKTTYQACPFYPHIYPRPNSMSRLCHHLLEFILTYPILQTAKLVARGQKTKKQCYKPLTIAIKNKKINLPGMSILSTYLSSSESDESPPSSSIGLPTPALICSFLISFLTSSIFLNSSTTSV